MATIRGALRCGTCSKLHVVRIGMGQGEYQSHKFACRGCKEQIGVGLKVHYETLGAEILPEENAELADEETGAEIVNLDANFLIPQDQQGVDHAFPRLDQMHSLVTKTMRRLEDAGIDINNLPQSKDRRLDYAEESLLLRKAW